MRRCLIIHLIILLAQVNGSGQSYGLAFSSHEASFEKRTSLDIAPNDSLCMAKHFELEFDFNFIPNHKDYFGYVLRIITNVAKNIDIIYNQKPKLFRVIIEDNFSNISFPLDSPRIYREWSHLSLKFNTVDHTLLCTVNGKVVGTGNLPPGSNCYKFLWGANDFQKFDTKDIPAMQIKDIRISEEGITKYFWPLDQSSGDTCYDKIRGQMAIVKNPNWIKPKNQYWQLSTHFFIRGDAAVAYNPKQDKIYVLGYDSLATYSLNKEKSVIEWMPTGHLSLRLGNQAIYDTISDRLYDIFVDQHRVVSFDFPTRQWSQNFDSGKITEFWHFNKFVSPADSSLFIIGGYGQLKYKNLIQRYSFVTKKWDLVNPAGDYFSPRYLAALGIDPKGSGIYIVGGYGSKTGDQMLGPGNFYDLMRFDLQNHEFKKNYTLKSLGIRFTFANSMVIDQKSGEYYGLVYPNDSSNSNLQLIKSTFADSGFTSLANSIPYSFHDIESFSDLYYSPISNKLIAVTLHYSAIDDKERSTEVKIYTVNFPPVPMDVVPESPAPGGKKAYIVFVGLIVTAFSMLMLFRLKASRRKIRAKDVASDRVGVEEQVWYPEAPFGVGLPERKCKSSIYLFGQFQVFDKEFVDITGQFSPLLKELFLLIATGTIRNGRGVASTELDEILWHDKSDKDAKNNRAVNIAKLKALLEKVGHCTINKESGFWQFQALDESICIDYKKYIELLQQNSVMSADYIHPLINIARRGAFLYQTEYNWLDNIKSEVSNTIIDWCVNYIEHHSVTQDPEFVIEICNCIFYFDHLNEEALIYKCKCLINLKRHTLANTTYLNFAKDYKQIYGENFPKTFQEIVG